ncbi:hypothetical protein [Enteroccous phage Ef212]|nr:hypothetical protein [Enteroccous phage Ef212]
MLQIINQILPCCFPPLSYVPTIPSDIVGVKCLFKKF